MGFSKGGRHLCIPKGPKKQIPWPVSALQGQNHWGGWSRGAAPSGGSPGRLVSLQLRPRARSHPAGLFTRQSFSTKGAGPAGPLFDQLVLQV